VVTCWWRARDLARVHDLNNWVLQTRESSEMRLQTEQMGRSMMDWLRNQHAGDDHHAATHADVTTLSRHCALPTYPVAFALAASLSGASVADCLTSYAFGWAENMVQAAVKAVPLGQNAGQRILSNLADQITGAVADAMARDDASRQAFAPMLAILTVSGALPAERIMGVETGGCPHTAIREDASINLEAIDRMLAEFPNADIVFIESGGDNLAATFSPELSDLTIYVIDVAAGEKIPRKGGPGITKSDLFVINKTDLAPHVGANLSVMEADTRRMRAINGGDGVKPFVMTNLRTKEGLAEVVSFIEQRGMLTAS